MSQSLADQLAATALSGGNAGFIEDLYEKFLQDPASVEPAWAKYFAGLAGTSTREVAHGEIRERLLTRQQQPWARRCLPGRVLARPMRVAAKGKRDPFRVFFQQILQALNAMLR